jgi:hypothetical protein
MDATIEIHLGEKPPNFDEFSREEVTISERYVLRGPGNRALAEEKIVVARDAGWGCDLDG